MKINTKKICLISIFTAMYCVLSALMKFTVIGNIQIDLGYVVLSVACATVGPWACFVGSVGCAMESMLFSAYGFSISWFVANMMIGFGCGMIFKYKKNVLFRIIAIIVLVAASMLGVKTIIECSLYNIPLAVKLPKNAVAFAIDSAAMIIGIPICQRLNKTRILYEIN